MRVLMTYTIVTLSTADDIDEILALLSIVDEGIDDLLAMLSTADNGIDKILAKLSTAD